MSHLSLETIARLVDEQPSALDNAHLEACATCRAELDCMRADVDALATLPDVVPAPASWDTLSARLRQEGLIQTGVSPFRRRTTLRLIAQAAGIAVVFLGGALAGRALRNDPAASGPLVADAQAPVNVTQRPQATASGPVAEPLTTPAESTRSARLVSDDATPGNAREEGPVSEDEALRRLRAAEDSYFNALSSYSQTAGTQTSDPTTRLAALEAIVITTRAALGQAPTDPVINGYHLTALAQRDAMLKQIKATPATSW
jgi:hypothetical protein